MNIHELFLGAREPDPYLSGGDIVARRWMNLVSAEGRRHTANASAPEAAANLAVAVEEGMDDAVIRLSGTSTWLKRYAEALKWCQLAEAEGLAEAFDPAVRCC
ncbi:hypothetical protein [Amycolatopsis palatopharyngis]|uniref:hypothetical protein n=1 Tax=Amycolatopsis palatopharyngis TaxID=187982 RepID=UPI000E220E55|nr:hypothetical protein [Amycolatopsis palatopharyngis]